MEVNNSIFIISEENNKFELYKDSFDKFSFEELKGEVEEIRNYPNIIDDLLEDETIGRRIIKTYWKFRSEKSSTDGYVFFNGLY